MTTLAPAVLTMLFCQSWFRLLMLGDCYIGKSQSNLRCTGGKRKISDINFKYNQKVCQTHLHQRQVVTFIIHLKYICRYIQVLWWLCEWGYLEGLLTRAKTVNFDQNLDWTIICWAIARPQSLISWQVCSRHFLLWGQVLIKQAPIKQRQARLAHICLFLIILS